MPRPELSSAPGGAPVVHRLLPSAAGPFRHRGGVRRLLGVPVERGNPLRPQGVVPPVGFRYLSGRLAFRPVLPPPNAARLAGDRPAARRLSISDASPGAPGVRVEAAQPTLRRTEPAAPPPADGWPDDETANRPMPEPTPPQAAEAAAARVPAAGPARPGGEALAASPLPGEPVPACAAPRPAHQQAGDQRAAAGAEGPARRSAPEAPLAEEGTAAGEGAPAGAGVDPPVEPTPEQREAAWQLLRRLGASPPSTAGGRPAGVEGAPGRGAAAPPAAPGAGPSPAPTAPRRASLGLPHAPPLRPRSTAATTLRPVASPAPAGEPGPGEPVERLRRATAELSAGGARSELREPSPAQPRPPRRPPPPTQTTVVVQRPPRPSRTPPAFWRRRHLNPFRLRPVR